MSIGVASVCLIEPVSQQRSRVARLTEGAGEVKPGQLFPGLMGYRDTFYGAEDMQSKEAATETLRLTPCFLANEERLFLGKLVRTFPPPQTLSRPGAGQQGADFDRCTRGGTGLGGFGGSFTGAHWVCGLRITHQKHKKIRRPSSGGGKFRGNLLFRRSLSRTSTFSGQGTLPSPTAGSRIRFPESLLMLRIDDKQRRRSIKQFKIISAYAYPAESVSSH